MQQANFRANFEQIVYLFQGGGALGAFQVGVYQALEELGYAPDWLVGISIGSINSAIIAGNPPEQRLLKLQQFWDSITHKIDPVFNFDQFAKQSFIETYNLCSALYTINFGQQGFFNPLLQNPFLARDTTPDYISFYDTTVLKSTLLQVIDFDYLNAKHVRLSLGAVNVQTGKLKFFDNTHQDITPEHIMASCALPPGFPAIHINNQYYWDGGIYSNTPLICVINDLPHKNRLCFLVDLFDSTGVLPNNLDAVLERAKDIQYSGHMDLMLEYYELQLMLQRQIAECVQDLPPAIQNDPNIQKLAKLGDAHDIHIAKIIYRAKLHELHSKDYEFSQYTAKQRMQEGYAETKKFLLQPAWWQQEDANIGTFVHTQPEQLHISAGSCKPNDDLYDEGSLLE